jgi:MIP family channel proteins
MAMLAGPTQVSGAVADRRRRHRQLVRRAAAEAIGTFFLVLIGPGAAMVNAATGGSLGVSGIALAFAFVIIAMVYALGHISGAHLNPAVTIAFWSSGRFPLTDVGPYIVAQCTGAVLGSGLLLAVLGPVGHLGATLPATVPSISIAAAFAMEWAMSFALMFVIMAVATDDRVAPGFAPIAVGLTVGFCALTGGPLTGASMNPARSFGPAVVGGEWHAHWLYWLAPVTAMLLATRAYDFLRAAGPPATRTQHVATGLEGPIAARPPAPPRPGPTSYAHDG